MRGALRGRRAATALLFATAAFAVVAFNSGVVVNAGCPFLEMQGKLIRFAFPTSGTSSPPESDRGSLVEMKGGERCPGPTRPDCFQSGYVFVMFQCCRQIPRKRAEELRFALAGRWTPQPLSCPFAADQGIALLKPLVLEEERPQKRRGALGIAPLKIVGRSSTDLHEARRAFSRRAPPSFLSFFPCLSLRLRLSPFLFFFFFPLAQRTTLPSI